jgi:Double-GTPase 1
MSDNTSVLVIGEHNVGKTNYGIQLLGRLRANTHSSLRLDGMPDTIAPFNSGLTALHKGLAPAHTPSTANLELVLPLKFNEQRVSLTWPDYGGEQISEILQCRSLSEAWQNRIANADGWMLFLRLSTIGDSLDAIAHPAPNRAGNVTKKPPKIDATETVKPWNSNAKFIELVQMLLHEKHIGIHNRVTSPALVVALSCWDELDMQKQEKPSTVLKQRLPLLSEFLTTTWDADRLSVFGVSSLGMAIESNKVNEAFRDEGPDRYGFVINPDGSRTVDLSEPVKWLMERIS